MTSSMATSPQPPGAEKQVYEFDGFRVDPVRRRLLKGGEQVSLTPKAFSILVVLLENRGEVVEKEELIRRIWPDTFVTEANLTQNVSSLRKALGERANDHRYVVTVPGRGYSFVAEVVEIPRESTSEFTIPAAALTAEPPPPPPPPPPAVRSSGLRRSGPGAGSHPGRAGAGAGSGSAAGPAPVPGRRADPGLPAGPGGDRSVSFLQRAEESAGQDWSPPGAPLPADGGRAGVPQPRRPPRTELALDRSLRDADHRALGRLQGPDDPGRGGRPHAADPLGALRREPQRGDPGADSRPPGSRSGGGRLVSLSGRGREEPPADRPPGRQGHHRRPGVLPGRGGVRGAAVRSRAQAREGVAAQPRMVRADAGGGPGSPGGAAGELGGDAALCRRAGAAPRLRHAGRPRPVAAGGGGP